MRGSKNLKRKQGRKGIRNPPKGKCERCGRTRVPLTRHSPQENHEESKELDNWEYMCRICHNKIHGMKATGLRCN